MNWPRNLVCFGSCLHPRADPHQAVPLIETRRLAQPELVDKLPGFVNLTMEVPRKSLIRKLLTRYLCFIPLGTWPEFCAQDRSGHSRLLASRDMNELLDQFWLTIK